MQVFCTRLPFQLPSSPLSDIMRVARSILQHLDAFKSAPLIHKCVGYAALLTNEAAELSVCGSASPYRSWFLFLRL